MSKYALPFNHGKVYEILHISMLPNKSVALMQLLVIAFPLFKENWKNINISSQIKMTAT